MTNIRLKQGQTDPKNPHATSVTAPAALKGTNIDNVQIESKRKPRMTKEERKFFDEVSAIVFATPEVRDGKNFMDRKAFAALPEETQKRWLDLSIGKTF